jgi:hypothetical protein
MAKLISRCDYIANLLGMMGRCGTDVARNGFTDDFQDSGVSITALTCEKNGAGDGNRNRVTSLEVASVKYQIERIICLFSF